MRKLIAGRSKVPGKQEQVIRQQLGKIIDWLVYWSGSKDAPKKKPIKGKLAKIHQ